MRVDPVTAAIGAEVHDVVLSGDLEAAVLDQRVERAPMGTVLMPNNCHARVPAPQLTSQV